MRKKSSSLSELEAKGSETIANNNTSVKKKVNSTKMAFSTSSFLNLFWPGGVTRFVFIFSYATATFLFYPYLWYFIKGAPVPAMPGSRLDTFDPHLNGWTMMYPFIIINILTCIYAIVFFIGKSRVKQLLLKEKNWIESLPFGIINFPDVLGGRSGQNYRVKIYYTEEMPEEKRIKTILSGFQTENKHNRWKGIRYYRRYSHKKYEELHFLFKGVGSRSDYMFHRNFHRLIDSVYTELHREYTIDKVEVE